MTLILDPAQQALKEKTERLSRGGQVERFSRAFSRALDTVQEDLALEGGQPNLQAALEALAAAQAHLIAQGDPQHRQKLIHFCDDAVRQHLNAYPPQHNGRMQ